VPWRLRFSQSGKLGSERNKLAPQVGFESNTIIDNTVNN
jgi:hypothetical protein